MKYAVDVHSEWGADLSGMIARHQPEHVILHTYHGYEAPQHAQTFLRQCASVQAAGKTVGCYTWAFRAYSARRTIEETVDLFRRGTGHDPPVVWIDCETYNQGGFFDPGPDAAWLREAFLVCDALGLRSGVYTANWWIDGHFPGGQEEHAQFGHRYLWLAAWDRNPSLETAGVRMPQGFSTLHAKQWAVDLPGQESLDRDVILDELTVPATAPAPQPQPEPQPDEWRIGYWHLRDVSVPTARVAVEQAEQALVQAKASLDEAQRITEQFGGSRP